MKDFFFICSAKSSFFDFPRGFLEGFLSWKTVMIVGRDASDLVESLKSMLREYKEYKESNEYKGSNDV